MKNNNTGGYDPAIELAKGAELTAASYDKTQTIAITAGKVTVGGKPGIAEISGLAAGRQDAGIDGTINLWLSIFRYMRPDGTIDHVGGWNIPLTLKAKQTPIETAKAFAAYINAGTRPYKAKAAGNKIKATVTREYANEKDRRRAAREATASSATMKLQCCVVELQCILAGMEF